MKLKRSADFLGEKEEKKTHPGIGSFSDKEKKKHNDRTQLELLKKKLELEKEKHAENKEDSKKEKEKDSDDESIIKKAGKFLKGELTKKYEPVGRYY